MTPVEHANAALRLVESTVVPLREPSFDAELCREAALRLRAAADVVPRSQAWNLRSLARFIEAADTEAGVATARRLLGRDLGPGAA